jgi:hypothetical protein
MANIAAPNVADAVQSSTVVAAERLALVGSGLIVSRVRTNPDINADVSKMMQAFRYCILSWP